MVKKGGQTTLFEDYKDYFKKAIKSRVFVLTIFLFVLMGVLIQHLFKLQIIHGEEYLDEFKGDIEKTRTIPGYRGSILDRNGVVLAKDVPSRNIIMEDNGQYKTTLEHNMTLNGVAYRLTKLIHESGEVISPEFNIVLDDFDNYIFKNTNSVKLNRFKADIYGKKTVEELTPEQSNSTPEEIINYLAGNKRFSLVDKKIKAEQLKTYGLPETYTHQEMLDIVTIRYALSTNSFQKFIPNTISTDVSEETAALILENKDTLTGVTIAEQPKRVYTKEYVQSMAGILGYTGKASTEELETLTKQNTDDSIKYELNDIVGKDGLEKELDSILQGKKGDDIIYVDNVGTELGIKSSKEPEMGKSVMLTIDANAQNFAYQTIEQVNASILLTNIINEKTFTLPDGKDQSNIRIPIDDVYFALIDNNSIDINHFKEEDSSEREKAVYSKFEDRLKTVTQEIEDALKSSAETPYKDLSKETQVYYSYIVDQILMSENTNVLQKSLIDPKDEVYSNWKDPEKETVSFSELLKHAISLNWIDSSKLNVEAKYLDSGEIYDSLIDYITSSIQTSKGFHKKVYKYMLFNNMISGSEICEILYDQGGLDKNEDAETYTALVSGSLSAYDFMINKITNLEITPAQLALKPCSGSAVVTDPNTGEVILNVSYPGYDNNRLANTMDNEYYVRLNEDKSSPLYNKAMREVTAPGSTFKPITAIAGFSEGAVTLSDAIRCTGLYEGTEGRPVRCWIYPNAHGYETLSSAIGDSCNVYFSEVGYRLTGENHVHAEGLEKLGKYASAFGLNRDTGIELPESPTQLSSEDAVRSSIGQGNHLYGTTHLARYVSTLANRGTVYELTLVKSIVDAKDNVLEEKTPTVDDELNYPTALWDAVQEGMQKVVRTNSATKDLESKYQLSMAGKTGTAEESDKTPNHGLFIGYAPVNEPKYAIAVRIANGYSSKNAAFVASNIMKHQFNLVDDSELVPGEAVGTTSQATDQTRSD